MNSEDKKIKEALIKFHKSTIDIDGIKGKDIVAWIENQPIISPEEMRDLLSMDYSKGRYDAITKAVEWLDEHLLDYWGQQNSDPSEFFIEFKKAMEGE